MLEHIINEFGTRQDKRNLTQFKEDFTRYAECCVVKAPVEIGKMSEDDQIRNMFVTLDDSFDNCTVSHLNIFIDDLRKILNISSHVHLKLCRICQGSLILTFQLPLFVHQAILPLSEKQEKALVHLGVVKLSCGIYYFTRKGNKVSS